MLQNFISRSITFFSFISITDIIDILLVSFLVYQLIRLIRQTRAEQLVKGILIIFVILQVSTWFNFSAIRFLIGNTMQLGLFAILILFQPELRNMLEHVGRSKVGRLLKFSDENISVENIIESIVSAVESMSKNHIGALIVMEKNTMLGEIIKTGTVLDANISSELLVNIFVPNTPLHDGAVIIRNEKIAAAACFLPLSQNINLSKDLGTRHRAALGISEVSDASIIVVSEETGCISVAHNGNLTRNLTAESLTKLLYKSLSQEQHPKHNNILFWKTKSDAKRS